MNIELKTMKCDECGSNDSVFDERMGEHVCNVRGLVIVTEMFEETVRLVDDGKVIKEADKGYLVHSLLGITHTNSLDGVKVLFILNQYKKH